MGVKGGLRHRVHAVIAAHDRQVNPQRHLDVGVAQPRADHIQRDLPHHEPVPGRRMPGCEHPHVAAQSPAIPHPGCPFDTIADVPERSPHAEPDHLVPRRPWPASS